MFDLRIFLMTALGNARAAYLVVLSKQQYFARTRDFKRD
jgi:hypothetical protein